MSTLRTIEHTPAESEVPVAFFVNGTQVSLRVPARMTLADALREKLGLTGTHLGCEHGVCGMCTILVDGDAARACLLFAIQVDGSELTTVEGLGRPDDLHPLQESFGRHHGLQCGFCTPGFLMSAYDLLSHEPDVERQALPEELSGVICRCTGYRNIIDAVDEVATGHRDGLPEPINCGHHTLVGRGAAGSTAPTSEPTEVVATPELDRPQQITLPSGEPTIAIELTSSLGSSLTQVATVFDDVRLLARCLPGAELTDALGEDWYRGRARVALGPIRLSFNSIAHLLVHESDRMHVLAQGSDPSGGRAQAEIQLSAYPDDAGGTRLEARARVFLVGRIAGFGRALAGDVSRRMFEDFAKAVDQAARGEVPVAAKPPSGLRLLLDTILERRRRARENRRRRSEK